MTGERSFTDVSYYDYEENMVSLCNCGSQPTDFAKSRKDVVWVTEGLREFTWKLGGTCPRYIGAPEKLTLARLSRIGGKYVMLITTGQAIKVPLKKIKETNTQHPYIFVRLDCKQEDFIESLRSNHIHVVKGNYREELVKTCEVLDIRIILL